MEVFVYGLVALGSIAVIAALAFWVFRAEIRSEEAADVHRRGHHDTAYGKDKVVTNAGLDAV